MKFQYFNGLKFTRDDKTGYYLNSTIRKRMHRYVWEYYYGEIPKGYQIHHIDHNKANNDISNLQPMIRGEHASLHGMQRAKERYDELIENLNKNARPKANEWHGTEEGKEWHKTHYKNVKDKLHAKKDYVCKQCGKSFTAVNNGVNGFCSNKCKSKWRRESGVDDEERECVYCGSRFKINKYRKTRTCSRSCTNRQRAKDRKNNINQIS